MRLLLLSACLGSALLFMSCDNVVKSDQHASSSPVQLRLASYNIQDANAEGNPFAEQYTEIDDWMFENFQQATSSSGGLILNITKEQKMLKCPVNEDGFKLPYRDSLVMVEEARKNGDETLGIQGYTFFYAAGEMPDEITAMVREMNSEVLAEYYPVVPLWLAEAEYDSAAMCPNGDILTMGPVEIGTIETKEDADEKTTKEGGCCGGSFNAKTFYRYNADGVLISADKSWIFTFDDFSPEKLASPNMTVRLDGVVTFTGDDGNIVAVYDYDWTELGTSLPPMRDLHYFMFYPKSTLDQVYHCQQS